MIGLTIGGVLFSALLISSLVLNVHFFIRYTVIKIIVIYNINYL